MSKQFAVSFDFLAWSAAAQVAKQRSGMPMTNSFSLLLYIHCALCSNSSLTIGITMLRNREELALSAFFPELAAWKFPLT